jgi:hypothetical protein
MDETVLCRWLQIIELPRNILEIMSEHIERFGMSAAYAIYRFWDKDRNNETATLDLVHRTVSEQLTVRALDQIASKGSDADSKTPVTRRKVVTRAAFKGSNGQTCDMKALADGILLDARNLDATTRNELFEEIEKVLRTRNFVDAEA